jgi:REP element-mobilizing transposase RayT
MSRLRARVEEILTEKEAMVAGYHLIWSVYGSWLPNDPRGSSSHEIRVPVIAELGELYQGRKQVQPARGEIREFYANAEMVLKHERLFLTDDEISFVGKCFEQTIRTRNYTCYGCAIMPEHVHLLIRKHRDKAEEMIEHFQRDSREKLIETGRRCSDHPVWGGPGWKVFLHTREDMERIALYIRQNPIKAGRPAQDWSFVKKYDGWLPGFAERNNERK